MNKPSVILDAYERPMRADEASTAHRAASRFSQELASWVPPLSSADGGWLRERDTVVARIHDLADNNGWVSGAMTRYLDQAIGASYSLSARPNWKTLGMSFEASCEWASETEAKFWEYANDPRNYCDATEQQNFAGLIGLGFRHRMGDGEALAVAHWIDRPDFPYATAIQIIDPDRLSNPMGRFDDGHLRKGVEINDLGAAQGYHLRCVHPGDAMFGIGAGPGRDLMRWERLDKYVPGHSRRQVIHHFEPTRGGQTRGKPLLTPVLEKIKMLDRYEKTEMQAALVNAIFAAFITTPLDREETIDKFFGGQTGEGANPNDVWADTATKYTDATGGVHIGGLKVPMLPPGMKPEMLSSVRPNQAFGEFEKTALRYIAAASGQSYEELTGDWSSTNYSSARAAMLQSHKFMTGRRDSFAAGFASQVYVLWLEEAMDMGIVSRPPGTPSFWEAPAAWSRCKWRGTPRGWVDPTKEAQASKIRMESQLSTLQDETDEQGRDWEDVLEQQAREQQARRKLGLSNPSSPDAPIQSANEEDADDRDNRERRDAARATSTSPTRG